MGLSALGIYPLHGLMLADSNYKAVLMPDVLFTNGGSDDGAQLVGGFWHGFNLDSIVVPSFSPVTAHTSPGNLKFLAQTQVCSLIQRRKVSTTLLPVLAGSSSLTPNLIPTGVLFNVVGRFPDQ